MRDDEHFEYGGELHIVEKIMISLLIVAFVVSAIMFMKVD